MGWEVLAHNQNWYRAPSVGWIQGFADLHLSSKMLVGWADLVYQDGIDRTFAGPGPAQVEGDYRES